jgi:lysophospholipase L1-like esterase
VFGRRYEAIAVVAVTVCLTLLTASSVLGTGAAAAPRATDAPGPARGTAPTGCEQRLERAGHGVPVLVTVGASFTAGVGPGNPGRSWAVLLARMLHWDAVVYGVPGAGYIRAGAGYQGPVAGELARADLRALAPALVIVQAGHDDIGVSPGLERRRVQQAIAMIRAEAPRARIALLTVFTGRSRSPATYRRARATDRAIVTAGTAADPHAIIMDPLAAGWEFPRTRDGLHPTVKGNEWIARTVAGILRRDGVLAARAGLAPRGRMAAPVICDSGIRPA